MIKIVGYWSAPNSGQEDAFEQHYRDTHIELAKKVPHLRSLTGARAARGFGGGEPSHYRVVELTFDSEADMNESMQSPEWAAMAKDAEFIIETYGAINSGDYFDKPETFL